MLVRRRHVAFVGTGWLVVALGLVALGCDSDGDSDKPSVAAPSREASPVDGQRVRFRATDGKPVTGVLSRAAAGAPALVLVHQSDGGAEQWEAFVPYLHEAGFSTLAYDGRGGSNERGLISEAEGAVTFLRRDPSIGAIGIVGASIGANTAAFVLARDGGQSVKAGVALSPARSLALNRLKAAGRYRPRHLLVVADADEMPAARPFLRGVRDATARTTGAYGHGVDLLGAVVTGHDADRAAVVHWLKTHVRSSPTGA